MSYRSVLKFLTVTVVRVVLMWQVALLFWVITPQTPIALYSLAQLATDEHARTQAQTVVAPVTNHHHEYCGGGAFATIVLRHVHDVAFALVSCWPPSTLYKPTSQEAGRGCRACVRPVKFEHTL